MAKALSGHAGGTDPRMVSEMRRLRQRVRDLEADLVRLQEQNDVDGTRWLEASGPAPSARRLSIQPAPSRHTGTMPAAFTW
jgi:hypothetical protein